MFFFASARTAEAREGEGGGEGRGREGGRREGREMRSRGCPSPRGRLAASARTWASARTHLVLPQVTSKRTLQCVQVTDAPTAIVRSSVRPSVRKRPRDNHAPKAIVELQ
jgi:hypothetical protein